MDNRLTTANGILSWRFELAFVIFLVESRRRLVTTEESALPSDLPCWGTNGTNGTLSTESSSPLCACVGVWMRKTGDMKPEICLISWMRPPHETTRKKPVPDPFVLLIPTASAR